MDMATNAVASEDSHELLVAILAHELCHPLAPIRHAAALLKQEAVDENTLRLAAEVIERQAGDMHRLIGDLLDVSRMQAGSLDIRVERTRLTHLVERAVESAGPLARERGHTLHVSVSPDPVYLSIDVLRMRQALHNVIANASKFTDPHGHIHVFAHREDAMAMIVIRDTGIGIPAHDLETIFDLYWRCEQRERLEQGLGLGLYLARFLVEAHGGTITASSEGSGRGSVFTLRLPCEPSTPPAELPEDSDSVAAG